MKRELPDHAYTHIQKRIGVDVARFGDDATVLFPRQGLRAFNPVVMRNARTTEIAARLVVGKQKFGSEMEFIDDTGGWAGGVIDQARLAGVDIVPVNMSGKATDPRYFNRRSEINFLAAEWVKNGGWLPKNEKLIRQACALQYGFDDGKLRVIEKEQIKKDLAAHRRTSGTRSR
jgi:phage terminase large subunit